jgi:L-ribulose-5-phosphate 4-epimerase
VCSREEIVRIGQQMQKLNLVVGSFGNVSCRKENRILITPTSLDYDRMIPQDIVTLDLDGRMLDGSRKASSEYRMHVAIYGARPDIEAIVHTHSLYAIAFGLIGSKLPMFTEEAIHVTGPVKVAPYAETGTDALARNAASYLGHDGKAVILQGHGVVGIGRDLDEAMLRCRIVERTAKIYMTARGAGWDDRWEGKNG